MYVSECNLDKSWIIYLPKVMILFRSYSHHSLLSATPQIKALISNAKAKGYTHIALTDEDTISGLAEFFYECGNQDIQPILGTTLRLSNFSSQSNLKEFSKICLLAKNNQGYKSIMELVSIARTIQEDPLYHLTPKNIKEKLDVGKDFFILLCGNDNEVVKLLRAGKIKQAKSALDEYVGNFGVDNILLELAVKLDDESEEKISEINSLLTKACDELELRYVASPSARYLETDDNEAYRVVLAIRNQVRLGDTKLTRDFSLPSVDKLKAMFSGFPKSVEIEEFKSQFTATIRMDFDKRASEAYFPKFALNDGEVASDRLSYETYIGLIKRFHPDQKTVLEWKKDFPYAKLVELKEFATNIKPDTSKLLGYPKDYWGAKRNINDYIKRIEYELGIIIQKGYPEYFLVFGDLMKFCRENGIVTNTRGSAAGSLVGYLNEINVLDPLIYELPFERFLNPFRPSPPDIDGDFADDKRERVIQYIKEKYGGVNVSQIITFGTMLPRAGVRDVGRVLGVSYKKCDRLSKLIPIAPQGRKTTFAWAIETSEEFREVYEKDEESKRIIDIAKKIEGNYRHASSHAAGVIITPTKLTDYVAVQWDTEHKMVVAQYDMKICEKIGLIKMDILGITNLAILGNALELTEQRRNLKIDLLNVDIQDKKAFELLSKGRTMGTFQLSSSGMTRHLVSLGPTKVQDLMAMVALYRPGPMANIPDYIKRKKDPKKIKYYVPQMENFMKDTYGILVYQDDLLYSTIELAGYNWEEADVFRKGVGKKIKEVMDSQHIRFVEGCQKHSGISAKKAEEVWDLMVPFAAYGFNKAHASSYGMVAYWTAYMKAEYTVEFMTAYMTAESNNLDKIAAAIRECEQMDIKVLPPDINHSFDNFTIENDNTIRYGFGSVKNLGSDVIKSIIEDRDKNGKFTNMANFIERVSDYPSFNKRSIEALILAGCLDEIGIKLLEKIGV
jgi:DNA polymerase-3 subunit alpha